MPGLTIAEILEEVDERYPNAATTASKVRKLNAREKEIFRTIYRRKTATVFDITAGQFLYPLDFSTSKVIYAIVNGRRYEYEDIDDTESQPPFLYTYQNSLGIYPTPDYDLPGGFFVHHWKEPRTYSADRLNEEPDLDPDFRMLHVYGLIIDLAVIDEKTELANGYIQLFNALEKEFIRANREPAPPTFRVE